MRSINNIVDVTNFVLHELGQPLHAFDAAKLTGNIIVRKFWDEANFGTRDGGEDWLATLDEDLAKEAGWKRRTIARADTLDELAAKTDMDAGTLKATVARYNELCEQGRDADFVKPAAFLRPLRTPPYYALLGVRFCHGTTGGEPDDEETPKLNGQWARYLELELHKYRTESAAMPHKKMRNNAKKLDEADVANAAKYFAAQPK